MRQSFLKINLPPDAKPLYAGDFRELLAREGDGVPLLPATFFHYDDKGIPLDGLRHDHSGKLIEGSREPEIRTIGGRTWVGIVSMKEESLLFDQAVGVATRIVSRHYGRPCPISVQNPEFGFEATEYPVTYYLRDMVIKKGLRDRAGQGSAETKPKDLESVVKHHLERWLADRGRLYGFDVPKAERLATVFHELNEKGMRLRTKTGDTNQFVALVNGEFSMNAKLKGIWQVGNLQARGHGRVIPKGGWNS